MTQQIQWNRRGILAGAGALGIAGFLPTQAAAQGLNLGLGKGLGLGSLLGKATDGALDKLAQPGAFYGDEDIRIGLPIVGNLGGRSGGLFGRLMNAGNRLGVLGDVTRTINDAAGLAAGEAKPIFRDAINGLSFEDAPSIIKEDDGGTQYLRSSSNERLHSRFEPLVDTALEKLGVYKSFDGLAEKHSFIRQAGWNRQSINRSVTDQGLDGIFSYVGQEEREFRKNPVGNIGGALGDLLGK
ncbi:DUF4197 domain-containing protein [Erythrobacter crassostreae]|uniref:DUF4197 domain-containing protein n=1 Tax=Erythrobacter crassostreae TaxID=2828328 RepID=A0A9X1F282_9SPHN|nr:DUF4197 domain-containing protein [Erythrobacter crassostrea]MBV7258244.1 DUF4197 domain-containing protein [Erythrobacter crassostrea]